MDAPTSERASKPRRQQRSRGWMRARDREQLRLYNLQLDVNGLRQEIESLASLRALLHTRVLHRRDAPDGSYLKTVAQYYAMMHAGYRDVLWTSGRPVSGREYLSSIMDEQMRMGRLPRLDQFITMWKRYTEAFGGLQFRLMHARLLDGDSGGETEDEDAREVTVVAQSAFQCSVGAACIPIVFPHLAARPRVRDQFVGKTLRGSGQFTITFDATSHRIVRFDMALDLVGAILRAVGDPTLVADITSRALITPDGCIGSLAALELLSSEADGWTREATPRGRGHYSDGYMRPVISPDRRPRRRQMQREESDVARREHR